MGAALTTRLLEYAFQFLEPRCILKCAAVCRDWNQIVHKSVYLQLILRQSLHQSQLYDGERHFPPAERLRRLITRETNLDLLRPRISEFSLPLDQVLHTVSGKYVVTHPVEQLLEPDERDQKYTLCTIWVQGTAKRVRVPFRPFTDLFDLDIHQDIIMVQEDEGVDAARGSNLRMRALHLFNDTEDAVPYEIDGFRITESGWDGEDPHNIKLTVGGRVMIWCNGIVWIYDWQKGERLGRLPPESPRVWESCLGMAWAGKGIVLGLDMPHVPGAEDAMERTEANLAIFEVDTSFPGTSSLPLLLELPFCADLLTRTVRDLLDLPEDVTIATRSQEHLPFIQRNGPFGLVLVATEFVLNEDALWRLVIVLPTATIRHFHLQKERAVPPPHGAWRNQWDPFAPLQSIPFSEWSGQACTWAEPADSPSYLNGFYEAQNSLRLYNHNYYKLRRHGSLEMTIMDFNQKRLRCIECDFRTLGGLGIIGEVETQAMDEDRRNPLRYKREVNHPMKQTHRGVVNLGYVEINGEYVLGRKGASNVVLFDGERLFIQQSEVKTVWILDFGVKEIAGLLGEAPETEQIQRAGHETVDTQREGNQATSSHTVQDQIHP